MATMLWAIQNQAGPERAMQHQRAKQPAHRGGGGRFALPRQARIRIKLERPKLL